MKQIITFVLGAAAGAILALLFAPESGKNLRSDFQATAGDDLQRIRSEWRTGITEIHRRLDLMQEDLKQVLQQPQSEAGAAADDNGDAQS